MSARSWESECIFFSGFYRVLQGATGAPRQNDSLLFAPFPSAVFRTEIPRRLTGAGCQRVSWNNEHTAHRISNEPHAPLRIIVAAVTGALEYTVHQARQRT